MANNKEPKFGIFNGELYEYEYPNTRAKGWPVIGCKVYVKENGTMRRDWFRERQFMGTTYTKTGDKLIS